MKGEKLDDSDISKTPSDGEEPLDKGMGSGGADSDDDGKYASK